MLTSNSGFVKHDVKVRLGISAHGGNTNNVGEPIVNESGRLI